MTADLILTCLRRFRHLPPGLAAFGLLLHLGAAPISAGKPFKEIFIDCAIGDSINKALQRPDIELLINIDGICVEDVVVRRDRVTLRGNDPAVDGIQAATTDDPFGSALLIRGAQRVNVENLQITGAKHAGLLIQDARRNAILRNLRIEGNQEVGFVASNSLVAAYDLSITGNGFAGVALSETAYLRCEDCTVADNPSADSGFGVLGAAGALASIVRGSISAMFPLSFRYNAVAEVQGTTVTGYVAVDASRSASIELRGTTIDGSIRADGDSRVEVRNSRQVFNPLPGGNVVSGASQLAVGAGTVLIGETAFDEFSNGMFSGGSSLETLACVNGSDAICEVGVTMTSSSCSSCP